MKNKIDWSATVLEANAVAENDEMPDIELLYSNNQIKKAGKILIDPNTTEEEYLAALDILSNWRATHALPLNSIQGLLRTNARRVDGECTISQRLKRVPSIQNKLKRFPNMKLNTMQDIGGCRAVLKTVENVLELQNLLVNSKTEHQIISQDNYIIEPKESGYRGIHLIYKYCGHKKEIYRNHKIEIQIRSRIQHSWATAVEIVDTFTKNNLKTGCGDAEWSEFFKEISVLFSAIEGYFIEGCDTNEKIENYLNKTADKIENLNEKLNVINALIGYSVSTNILESDKNSKYFLLILDSNNKTIETQGYKKKEFKKASNDYIESEKKFKDNKNYNVALVSSDSIQALKIAYPNYFSDSKMFVENLELGFGGLNRKLKQF